VHKLQRPIKGLEQDSLYEEISMNVKLHGSIFVFITTLFAGAFSAHAGDLTFFIGGQMPGNLSSPVIVGAAGTYDRLGSSPVYGFRLSTNFVPMFGLEHTLGFSWDYLYPKANFPLDISSAHGFIYNSNLILNFPARHFVPYATAGIGLICQYGSPNLPVGTKLAFNYGGGLKLNRMLGPLGLRFDARGYSTSSLTFGGHMNIFEMSGGVTFGF
jgi:hypothetical protein